LQHLAGERGSGAGPGRAGGCGVRLLPMLERADDAGGGRRRPCGCCGFGRRWGCGCWLVPARAQCHADYDRARDRQDAGGSDQGRDAA
jgi:hypothetical protein